DGNAKRADGSEDADVGQRVVEANDGNLDRRNQESEDVERVKRDYGVNVPALRASRSARSWWCRCHQLTYCSGTGSWPLPPNGRQREIRRTAIHQPRRAPNRWIAS